MRYTSKWMGGRVGSYEIGRRYQGIPEEAGQLYEARHIETGEPALAVMPTPGDDWRLRSSWEVLTANFLQQGLIIVHPKRWEGTKAPDFHELSLGYIRIAGVLSLLDGQETIQANFSREARVPGARRRAVRGGLAGAGLALVAGLVLLLWPRAPEHPETGDVPSESLFFADGEDLYPDAVAYPMPESPFKEQRKPPCIEGREAEVRGGCWILHTKTAPCPRSTAEFQGKCYVPVKKPDPQPSSVQP